MNRYWIVGLLVGGLMCAWNVSVHAIEPSASTPSSNSTSTPIAQVSATDKGRITKLDWKASPATLELTTASGKMLTITFDPKTTQVWSQTHQTIKTDQLKEGQWVKIRYAVKEGQNIASSIQMAWAPTISTSNSDANSKVKTQ